MATTSSATSAPPASAGGLTLPASLSGLTATAASSSEVDLSWTNVTGASGYEVDRKDSDGNWEDVGEVDSSTGTTSGYSDTGLDDGTAYTYQVIPFNDSGDANGSNPSASATTPLIAPDNVVAVALSSTSIEIVWDDESASSTGFEVQRSTDGTNFTDLASTGGADTDYTDTGLTPSTAYAYRVESTNPAAAPSAPSEPASATTPAAPASDAGPQTPTLTAEVVSAGEIELTWPTPTDESNLELEEQGPGDNNFRVVAIPSPTTTDDQTSCSIGGLTAGDQYSFRLRADLNGQEAYSPAVSATPAAVPDGSLPTPTIESMSFLGNAPGDGSGNGPQVFDGDFSVPAPSDTAQATAEANAQSFITAVGLDPYHVTPLTGTQSDNSFNFSAGDNDFHYIVDASPYGYQVSVQLVGGSVSQPSDAYTLNTDGPYPDAPVLTSTPGDDGTVVVSWSQPGDSSSDVNTSLFQLVNGTATPIYQPSDGPSGSTSVSSVGAASQVFAISETAEQGASSYYSNFIDIPPTIPATPANLSATPYSDGTGSGIRLLWDNTPDNETGFTVQRSTSAEFSTDLQSFTVDADVTSYVDSADASNDDSVQPGTTYYYRVEATNDTGDSGFSSVVDAAVALPTVSVSALPIIANAAGPNGMPQDGYLEFSRSGNPSAALTANVTYAGTAVAGTDYSALPTQVMFAAGSPDVIVPVAPVNTTPGASSVVEATVTSPSADNYVPGGSPADVDVAIHGLAVTLGDGSDGLLLLDSPDGREDVQPLTYITPEDAAPGTTFTLSINTSKVPNAANLVDVWTQNELSDPSAAPLFGDGVDAYTWTVGATSGSEAPPTDLSVGAIGSSNVIPALVFNLAEADPGVPASQPAASKPGELLGVSVTFTLLDSGKVVPATENDKHDADIAAAGGIDKLGPLPLGQGRSDHPGIADTNALMVVAAVAQRPKTPA